MAKLVFVVSECPEGWIITGPSVMGPFVSKARALDLAEGMASALEAAGEDAEVKVGSRAAPEDCARAGIVAGSRGAAIIDDLDRLVGRPPSGAGRPN